LTNEQFGDARYKLPAEIQDKLQEYWGRQHPANFKTPPYVTAEPVVTTTTLTPSDMKDSFIVMGTDGLWEKLTNEEVVGLVGKWIDRKNGVEKSSWFGKTSNTFNVTEAKENAGAKKPGKRDNKWIWQDSNVATHLIRNALGGGNLDEVCLMVPAYLRFAGSCRFRLRWRGIIEMILLFRLFFWGI
jgi:pyruvate dehydrogenase phosphatase